VQDDLPGLLALYRHLNPEDPAVEVSTARAIWADLLGSDTVTIFVVEAGGPLVSSCMLVVVPNLTRNARPFGLIENVVTHAEHRRHGFGSMVLRAALDAAWNAGCYKVMLMTGSRQESTMRFYERAGFERRSKTAFQIRRP
jgi:GNAT superfamily N-acetyltransferase